MATSLKTIQYRYDSVGNRIGMTDPDGGRFTYAYNNMRQITHLENLQDERTTYTYDEKGRRTAKKLANGTRVSFTYDAANNLTRLANLKSDGTTISSFQYTYDKVGNRTSVLEADGSRVTWTYDLKYQLTGEHRTGSHSYRHTFAYDPSGNRALKNEDGQRTTYAYDVANQLTTSEDSLGTTTYTYDTNGNQQIVEEPSGARTTTTWDYENCTTLVELPGGVRNTIAYAPDGLRIKLEDSTGTRKFIWDDQNYLAETDASEVTQVVYTNEPALYGNLISQRRGSTTIWYHFDVIGSTRELTLASEVVSDTYLYDAWGVPHTTIGGTTNPFRYVGRLGYYFDIDTENSYVRQRIYSPALSRWLSNDPLGLTDGMNLYMYARNNTLNMIDRTGLQCECDPTLEGLEAWSIKHTPRGRFWRVMLGPRDPSEDWFYHRVGSDFELQWSPVEVDGTASFCDPCCCERVGIVQIVSQRMIGGLPFLTFDYRVDRAIPYPNGPSPSINPCTRGARIRVNDAPNFATFLDPVSFRQSFESCAVCLGGVELGNVYGCVRWGHRLHYSYYFGPHENVTRGRLESVYDATRNLAGATGSFNTLNHNRDTKELWLEDDVGLEPTSTMIDILTEYVNRRIIRM